ncbi:Tc toxin subunit A [Xenorhabdus indica]|uniref:Tc toxin subunit A n=1 Tax=Xenorhabdus indica TaxID=333964 RepID=UPI0016575B9A|nr:Tc toxin subunit A [Xenorhabdus indica]MBC8947238.1 hypothetical protein [Xenorhabdus indica]
MTLPLQRLEVSCQLTSGTLASLELASLQDILAYTENGFISKFGSDLGFDGARTVYRTALTGQQQLIKLFRQHHGQLPQHTKETQNASKLDANVSSGNPQVWWKNQFPEKEVVVPPGSIGDSSSPAAYAASLYALATKLEKLEPNDSSRITLAKRRSHLGDTLLSDVTVNQRLPKLDIVNDILQNGLDNKENNEKLIGQLHQQGVLPDRVTSLPSDVLLSRLHYPGKTLPYHEPHDQVVTGLSEHQIDLASLTQSVGAGMPAFSDINSDVTLSARVLQQAASLSPSEVSLITAEPVFDTYILDRATLTHDKSYWDGPSFSELLPWQDMHNFAYVVPLKSIVQGPRSLSGTLINNYPTLLTLTLNNEHKNKLILNAEAWAYSPGALNDASGTSYPYKVCIGFDEINNKSLPLNEETPLRAQLQLRAAYLEKNDNNNNDIAFSDFTVSVVLSTKKENENVDTLLTKAQQDFLLYNFGSHAPLVNIQPQLSTFTQVTGLSANEVMQLLCAAGVGQSSTSVVASNNVERKNKIFVNDKGLSSESFPAPYHYGAVFIHGGKLPRLFLKQDKATDPATIDGLNYMYSRECSLPITLYDRYDRINRMVRLQRRAGMPFDQLDNLIVSAMRAEGQNNLLLAMNTHTLRTLGFYQLWHKAYGLKAEDLAAFLYEVTPFAIGTALPQFDRFFNPRTKAGQDPLVIDNKPFDFTASEGADAITVHQLCAGLAIGATEFQILAEQINKTQHLSDGTSLNRSFKVVSALYRLSKIPALLGISVAEMLTLLTIMPRGKTLLEQLAGIPQLAPLSEDGQPTEFDLLDDLQTLAEMVKWMKGQNLSVVDVVLLLTPMVPQATQSEIALVNDINQHLNNILFDANSLHGLGLPIVDKDGKSLDWITLLTGKVIDSSGLIINEMASACQQNVAGIVKAQHLSDDEKTFATKNLNNALTNILRSQQTIIDTQLGKVLGVPHGVVLAMLPCLSLSSYTLLTMCQHLNKTNLSPTDIPSDLMKNLNTLGRYSRLVTRYRLTPATLQAIHTYPEAFGDSQTLPLSLSLLTIMNDYTVWRHATGKEDDVLQYLRDVYATPSLSSNEAASRLATHLDWSVSEVKKATELVIGHADGVLNTVAQIGHLVRLRDCADKTGLSVSLLQQITKLEIAEPVLKEGDTSDKAFDTWRSAGLAVMATLGLNDNNKHA